MIHWCCILYFANRCICPPGFKGKTCHELEFCAIHECPVGGECRNLNDGYECLSSATFNGVNSSVSYASVGIASASPLPDTIQFAYRSHGRGGTVLVLKNDVASSQTSIGYMRVDVEAQGVVVRWVSHSGQAVEHSVQHVPQALDGDWHSVVLNISSVSGLANVSLSTFVSGAQIVLGGGDSVETVVHSLVERDVSLFDTTLLPDTLSVETSSETPAVQLSASTSTSAAPLIIPPTVYFRGCLKEVRIGGVLLPFFSAAQLASDPSAVKFVVASPLDDVERQCRLCYDDECRNGGRCVDPAANFTCDCLAGFRGDVCEVNIDECLDNRCVNGACVDAIANYTCDCQLGWAGWL